MGSIYPRKTVAFRRPTLLQPDQRDARKRRRKESGAKPKFLFIRDDGQAVYELKRKQKPTGKYTQAELKSYFGIVVAVPKRFKERAQKRRQKVREIKKIMELINIL